MHISRLSRARKQSSTRQAYSKNGALTRLARHGHIAAHHASELAGDGEAEPGAAETLRGGFIRLAELLEQLGLLLSRHADARIGDRQFNPVAAVGPAGPQLDLAVLRKLAGIAQ